mgnify:CR=1 FL=1
MTDSQVIKLHAWLLDYVLLDLAQIVIHTQRLSVMILVLSSCSHTLVRHCQNNGQTKDNEIIKKHQRSSNTYNLMIYAGTSLDLYSIEQ